MVEVKQQDPFLLPTGRSRNNVPGQGWQLPTLVKTSNIPNAGNGRFALDNVSKGSKVLIKPMKKMSEVGSIFSFEKNEFIFFKNANEIEKFIELYSAEGGQSRDKTVDCLAHFIFSLQNIDGVALCFSSCSTNHGDPGQGENFRFIFENGVLYGEATVDIKAGDELLLDYRQFEPFPSFWTGFCVKEGERDVVTVLKEAIECF